MIPTVPPLPGAICATYVPHLAYRFFTVLNLTPRITHGAMTPIDVVKTRIQIHPAFKNLSFISGTRHIIKSEGPAALLTGFGPTALGYFVQGGGKFAGYEYWSEHRLFVLAS
jgi:solute carrier family 25 (mitochondrial phosphate transporter), member 3